MHHNKLIGSELLPPSVAPASVGSGALSSSTQSRSLPLEQSFERIFGYLFFSFSNSSFCFHFWKPLMCLYFSTIAINSSSVSCMFTTIFQFTLQFTTVFHPQLQCETKNTKIHCSLLCLLFNDHYVVSSNSVCNLYTLFKLDKASRLQHGVER